MITCSDFKNFNNNSCIMKEFTKEQLEKYHTKQLIKILRAQSRQLDLSCADGCKYFLTCKKIIEKNIILLKEILATRPHIPNKKESKAIRKAKKKNGK